MPSYENRGSYLFVQITEPYSLPGALAFLRDLAQRCEQAQLERALVDGASLEAQISIWERYRIGREYIQVIGPRIQIAFVAPPSLINSVMENVIANRHGTLRVFQHLDAAQAWLELHD